MMIKSIIFAFLIVLFTQTIHPAFAQKTDAMTLKYDVFSEGKNVGQATVKLSRSGNTYLYTEYSRIKASGWWGKIDVKSIVVEEHENGTVFVRAGSKSLDAKTVYQSALTTKNSGFTGTFAEISKATVRERNEIMDLAFAISGKQTPDTKVITALSPTMFENRLPQSKKVQFARDAFDTTWNNLPFFLQKYSGSQLPEKLDIMDAENLVITTMRIMGLGLQELSIGGRGIKTRYIKLSDLKNKPMTIWINADQSSMPYVIRHVGENEDGPFELRLRP